MLNPQLTRQESVLATQVHPNLGSAEDLDNETAENLVRIADKLPPSVWALAVLMFCERSAYYGLSAPLQNYIQNAASDRARPGALGLGQEAATNLNYVFTFLSYLSPIGCAVLSDSLLGRYKTLLVSMPIYIAGLLILFASSFPSVLNAKEGLGCLVVAISLIGIGSGGFKSCLSPLIADQYIEPTQPKKITKGGKEVLVDKTLTLQSIFSTIYWSTNMGASAAIATVWLEKGVGFWAAYLVPLCMLVVATALLSFHRIYVIHGSKRSVLLEASSAVWIGIRAGFDMEAARPQRQLDRFNVKVPWDDRFVDEINTALLACRIFAFWPIWRLCQSQWGSNLKSQAAAMETHGIPNDLLLQVNVATVMIFLPVMENIVYPFFRKHKIIFSIIDRMAIGFFLESLAMGYAAIVQHLVYAAGPCYEAPLACSASRDGSIPNHVHVAVQIPIYFLEGLAEIFAAPAALQFAYVKAPQNLKSTLQALLNVTGAVSAIIGIGISPMYKDPRLVVTYSLLAGVMFFALGAVLWIFRGKGRLDDGEKS